MGMYKSLPPRPSIDEVEAAMAVIKTAEAEEQRKLEEISKQEALADVPEELFFVLQEVKKNMVLFQSKEQRKEAVYLLEVDRILGDFDGLIQKASVLVSGDTGEEKGAAFGDSDGEIKREIVISSEILVEKIGFKGFVGSSSTKAEFLPGKDGTEKLSLMQTAALIETIAKTGDTVLNLKGRLMDKVEWLPVSLGKLKEVNELDFSENQIMALPASMANLKALTKLDLHSNQLFNLPDSFGEISNLMELNIRANMLKSLPPSFGNLSKLISLDLSSNKFTKLPETIGTLFSLKNLIAETNDIEELPHAIGNCVSLIELRLDFNQLKALPEAIGKLVNLEILTAHYNRLKSLPTTMSNLSKLKELDVNFNEIEYIPETLCFAASLRKLNVSHNFADLRALPQSIGCLEMLEELDISDSQIRILPDSFRFLSNLRVFRAVETPLEVPPRQVSELGAQAVVQFMSDFVEKTQPLKTVKKKKGFWFLVCWIVLPFLSGNNNRRRNANDGI